MQFLTVFIRVSTAILLPYYQCCTCLLLLLHVVGILSPVAVVDLSASMPDMINEIGFETLKRQARSCDM
jgi:hypothetical protein